MIKDFLGLAPVREGVPAPRVTPGEPPGPQRVLDLSVAVAALAAAGQTTRAGTLMAQVVGTVTGGRVGTYILGTGDTEPLTNPRFRLTTHLWALLAGSCSTGIPDALLTPAVTLAQNGPVVLSNVVQWATFRYGDGTLLGEPREGRTMLLRETALLGLALYNEGQRRGDPALITAAHSLALYIPANFRSDFTPTIYAPLIRHAAASASPDAEAYALAGLLCHRLGFFDVADELLTQLERAGAARLTRAGHAFTYGTVRQTVLAAAYQHVSGQYGLSRATLRGMKPLRVTSGAYAVALTDDDGTCDLAASHAAEVCQKPRFLASVGVTYV